MPCGATQFTRVIVERSDSMWYTGEGNGKPIQSSCLENPMNSMKGKNHDTERNSPGWSVHNILMEISGEITPERMRRQNQSKNNTQLWMSLVIEKMSNAVTSNIA